MGVVFIHGAGKDGASAWPKQVAQADPGWSFLPRGVEGDDAARDALRILADADASDGAHVVAHSYGANAAVLAAQTDPAVIRSLVLFEPACFDLARGMSEVEAHIAAMTPVFDCAGDPAVSTREFSALFAAGMGTEPPNLPEDVLEAQVGKLRALRPPWGLGLEPAVGLPVPTLVLTGGWSPLYEQTAQALVELGAQHQRLTGAGHRVQDAPTATEVLRDFW